MWQVTSTTRALRATTVMTSTYDMTISVFLNRAQLPSDDSHKAVMNTVQYNRIICIQ